MSRRHLCGITRGWFIVWDCVGVVRVTACSRLPAAERKKLHKKCTQITSSCALSSFKRALYVASCKRAARSTGYLWAIWLPVCRYAMLHPLTPTELHLFTAQLSLQPAAVGCFLQHRPGYMHCCLCNRYATVHLWSYITFAVKQHKFLLLLFSFFYYQISTLVTTKS